MRILRQILLNLCLVNLLSNSEAMKCEENVCLSQVLRFQEYFSLNTVTGQDLSPVDFWNRLDDAQGHEVSVFEGERWFPIISKWPEDNSTLPNLLLNAHMDIAPAFYRERWIHQLFSGIINNECEVGHRGAQDVKVLSNLKQFNDTLLRYVFIVLTPDGLSLSQNSLGIFLQTETFKNMNVGVLSSIGIASEKRELAIFHQDKTIIGLRVECHGQSTFSALLVKIDTTAARSCNAFYNAYINQRENQYIKSLNSDHTEYTAVNHVGHLESKHDEITFRKIDEGLTVFFSVTLTHDTSLEQFKQVKRLLPYK